MAGAVVLGRQLEIRRAIARAAPSRPPRRGRAPRAWKRWRGGGEARDARVASSCNFAGNRVSQLCVHRTPPREVENLLARLKTCRCRPPARSDARPPPKGQGLRRPARHRPKLAAGVAAEAARLRVQERRAYCTDSARQGPLRGRARRALRARFPPRGRPEGRRALLPSGVPRRFVHDVAHHRQSERVWAVGAAPPRRAAHCPADKGARLRGPAAHCQRAALLRRSRGEKFGQWRSLV